MKYLSTVNNSLSIVPATYRLKRLDSTDADFPSVVQLFRRHMSSGLWEKPEDIIDWLEASTPGNTFNVFGGYRNRKVISYVGVAHLAEEELLVFDQIIFDESCRGRDVQNLVNLLSCRLKNAYPNARNVMAPVGDSVSQSIDLVTRLMRHHGFVVTRAPSSTRRLYLGRKLPVVGDGVPRPKTIGTRLLPSLDPDIANGLLGLGGVILALGPFLWLFRKAGISTPSFCALYLMLWATPLAFAALRSPRAHAVFRDFLSVIVLIVSFLSRRIPNG